MSTADWLGTAIVLAGMTVALIIAEISKRAEARRRAKERARDRETELARFAIELRAHKRRNLREMRKRYVDFAAEIGSMPQPIAAAIADIDQQIAAMRAEQIRKLTEEAAP